MSLTKAAEYYQAAMALEPDWAPPYAGLAEAGRIQAFSDNPSYVEVVKRTRALTGRALSLDRSNAQAHATLGAVIAMYLWKWEEGEERIQLALETTLVQAQVEHLYSMVLLAQGRYEEALQHIDGALAIEHSSRFCEAIEHQLLLFARRYEESIHESEDFPHGTLRLCNGPAQLWRSADAGRPLTGRRPGSGASVCDVSDTGCAPCDRRGLPGHGGEGGSQKYSRAARTG